MTTYDERMAEFLADDDSDESLDLVRPDSRGRVALRQFLGDDLAQTYRVVRRGNMVVLVPGRWVDDTETI